MEVVDWLLDALLTREPWARELRLAGLKEMLTGRWLSATLLVVSRDPSVGRRLAAMISLLVVEVESDMLGATVIAASGARADHCGLLHAAVVRAGEVRCRSSLDSASRNCLDMRYQSCPHQLRRLAAAVRGGAPCVAAKARTPKAVVYEAPPPSTAGVPKSPARPSPSAQPVALRVVTLRGVLGSPGATDWLHVCSDETLASLYAAHMRHLGVVPPPLQMYWPTLTCKTEAAVDTRQHGSEAAVDTRQHGSASPTPRLMWLDSLGVYVELPIAGCPSAWGASEPAPQPTVANYDREMMMDDVDEYYYEHEYFYCPDDGSDTDEYHCPRSARDQVSDYTEWGGFLAANGEGMPRGRGNVSIDKGRHNRKRWLDARHSHTKHSRGALLKGTAARHIANCRRAATRSRLGRSAGCEGGCTAPEAASTEQQLKQRREAQVGKHGFMLRERSRSRAERARQPRRSQLAEHFTVDLDDTRNEQVVSTCCRWRTPQPRSSR